MNPDAGALRPQQRLEISRKALIAQLGSESPSPEAHASAGTAPPAALRKGGFVSWAPVARNVARRWWRRHPANAAGQLARPLIERYARKQPGKLVAVAAAAGALVVLARPWRLLSVAAVVAAALKTSDVADMVTSLMQKNSTTRKDPS